LISLPLKIPTLNPERHLNQKSKVRYHNAMPTPKHVKGLTLVEMLVSMAILAIFLMLSIPHLLGTLDQNVLQANTDQFATVLHMARQYSLSAKPGLDPTVDIDPSSPITLIYTPALDPARTFTLSKEVQMTEPTTTFTITFDKLYGTVPIPQTIKLEYKGYTSSITVEKSGDISTTKALKI
jgi:prepilin-type N-terminal cleavage/methylation domain-containing protein